MSDRPDDLPNRLIRVIIAALETEKGVHAETAIASAAVFTGECVLLASGYDISGLPPASTILSDSVNQLLYEAEGQLTISDVFINALYAQGVSVDKDTWPEAIPDNHQVMIDPLEVVARLRSPAHLIFETENLEGLERAYAAATATAYLVSQTRRVLDPDIGKALALEAMLRGAKTVPLPSAMHIVGATSR